MQFMADEVAICFSILDQNVVLHKHGGAADVQAWWKKNHEAYSSLFGDLHIVESGEWSPVDLTECLDRPFKILELLHSIGKGITQAD